MKNIFKKRLLALLLVVVVAVGFGLNRQWAGNTLPQAFAQSTLPYEEIEMITPDGRFLYGQLFDPSQKPESEDSEEEEVVSTAPVPKYPLVILAHGLNGDHRDWEPLPAKLVQAGYAVLAIDLRGHGQSTKIKGRGLLGWRQYKKTDWDQMPQDLERLVRYFNVGEGKDDYPQVNARATVLLGAKLGANAALIAGARNSEVGGKDKFKGLVLLSPSLDYKGLQTSLPIVKYNGPLLIIASDADESSFKGSQLLYRWALGAKSIKLYKGVGDSTDMLRLKPEIQSHVVGWIKKTMPGNPQHRL